MSRAKKTSHLEARRSPLDANEKIAELTADLQRLQAEFSNYRRRSEAGRTEILDLAKQDVIRHLLPLLDNIDRALSHRPAELDGNPWARGVEQVARQASETLRELGVERITAIGQPFDPQLHEAIAVEEPGAGGESGEEVVVAELQPGYRLGDRVIRHALVKVGHQSINQPAKEKGEV